MMRRIIGRLDCAGHSFRNSKYAASDWYDLNLAGSTIRDCNLKNRKSESCELEGATIDGIRIEELLEWYRKEHK